MGVVCVMICLIGLCCMCDGFLFFQAEDGIRDLVRSRGLGDVYKRQVWDLFDGAELQRFLGHGDQVFDVAFSTDGTKILLSLIHI